MNEGLRISAVALTFMVAGALIAVAWTTRGALYGLAGAVSGVWLLVVVYFAANERYGRDCASRGDV